MIRKLVVVLLAVAICLSAAALVLAADYNESPMLRTKVAAGELPPVEDRLPKNPLVLSAGWNEVETEDLAFENGQFGGTLRVDRDTGLLWFANNEPPLVAPGINTREAYNAGELKGNWLQDWEANEDSTVFTFSLREGLKWSDGVPVTMEDVLFNYEDIIMNIERTPTPPRWTLAGGEPMELEVLDPWTFTLSFKEPYPLFPYALGLRWSTWSLLVAPKHYLKDFHPDYASAEVLEEMIAENGFEEGEWWNLFNRKFAYGSSKSEHAIGFPTLCPWMYVGDSAPGVNNFVRNPYYYKVDAAGSQLPYIDKLVVTWIATQEATVLRLMAGDADINSHNITTLDYPILKEREESGGYKVAVLKQHATAANMMLNLTHEDPVWREVVRDVRFRRALDYGINREEIIDITELGIGYIPTVTPVRPYDPAKANQLLDEMGLDKRDADGWRLGPDGERFVIPIETQDRLGNIRKYELITEYWRDLGLFTTLKLLGREQYFVVRHSNMLKVQDDYQDWTVIYSFNPSAYFVSPEYTMGGFAPLWRDWWLSGGEKGEEPSAEVKRFLELYEISVTSVSAEERNQAIEDSYQLVYDQALFIVGVGVPNIAAYANDVGNAQMTGWGATHSCALEQLFFRK